jgi:hypothetical protein
MRRKAFQKAETTGANGTLYYCALTISNEEVAKGLLEAVLTVCLGQRRRESPPLQW